MTSFIATSLLGGILSRWHGGGFAFVEKILKIDFAKVFKNIVYALPFGIATGIAYQIVYGYWWLSVLVGLSALATALLKATGHGRGFRLKQPMEDGSKPEKIEKYLILWLMPYMPLYWYKVLLMSLTGLAPTIGAASTFAWINPASGAIIALGGLFKGINAMIFDLKTERREFADGAVSYAALALALLMI